MSIGSFGKVVGYKVQLYFYVGNKEMIIFFSLLFRATPAAYGSSQARGQIRAAATGLHHSHSNSRSKPRL